jgi:hypothetical protein
MLLAPTSANRDNKTVFELRSSVPGTRELVVPETPFVIPYRVRGNVLEALRAYHPARRLPERL